MKYTTNIPYARIKLLEIAHKLNTKGLADECAAISSIVETYMVRRTGPRRAPSTRAEVTDAIRKQVIQDLTATDLPQEEIARKYNIDGGRVSEIYRSLRN